MSKEQITLSYALDLIAQSKSDIKGSVEFKGVTSITFWVQYNVTSR